MSQTLIEEHELLVIEMAAIYLDNMELELGKKYKDSTYKVNASLSDGQYTDLKKKHSLSDKVFADLYSDFQKLKPTSHLKNTLDAFTASNGSVDIEPVYNEDTHRLNVSINFSIKDKVFEKLEGLSALEDIILRMNAMLQIDTVLSDADPDESPSF